MATTLLVELSCSDRGQGAGDGEPPDVITVELEPADRSDVSYVDNLLAKVESGEWTRGEGLVATLQLFAGERDAANVLLHPELLDHEGTGIFHMAAEYLKDGSDEDAKAEISRLLDALVFSVEQLQAMAGLATQSALFGTKDSVGDCVKFFRDHETPPGIGLCLEQESTTVDGKLYRVFFPAGNLPSAGWTGHHVTLALDAMKDAVPKYDELGKTYGESARMPTAALVFSASGGGGLWGSSFPSQDGPCGVAIFTALQSKSDDEFKQAIAHELAHCFQGVSFPQQHVGAYENISWHYEGLAEYLSNLVYPGVNLEWRFLAKLEEVEMRTSVVVGRSYENFLFFQYLSGAIGNDGILRLIGNLPSGELGALDHQEALAEFSGMAQTYHEFVKTTTDGRVEDSNHERIPFTARSVSVDLYGEASPYVKVPKLRPFGVARLLIGVDEGKQASLAFDGKGSITESSGPASTGVSTGIAGLVVESVVNSASGRDWSRGVPPELPEEECNTRKLMIVATNAAADEGFELSVPDFGDVNDCCLQGTWVLSNEDLAEYWTAASELAISVGGQLTAEFRSDGHVEIIWSALERSWVLDPVLVTDTINGGGIQSYSTESGGFGNLLTYGGPELTPQMISVRSDGIVVGPYPVALDAWYGDVLTTHPFECEGDRLVIVLPARGADYELGWSRVR
jgi:hypothetical protein